MAKTCPNDVEFDKKRHLEDTLYETALKDFLYLSEQRLKFIRFYIIVVGIFLSVVGFVFLKNQQVTAYSTEDEQ